jgi:lipoprotein
MKKIMFFVLGMLFLSSCGNNSSNSVAVAPEKRESIAKNPILISSRKILEEKEINFIKECEYNSLKEALLSRSNSYNYQQKILTGDNEKYIKEAERETKSKFYVYDDNIYYTPIDPSKGGVGKITIIYDKIELDWTNNPPYLPYIPDLNN